MLTRVITAAVGLPLLVGIIVLGDSRLFAGFVAVLTLLGLIEYGRMTLAGHPGLQLTGVAAGLAVAAAMLLEPGMVSELPVLASAFTLLCVIFLFTPGDLQQRYARLGVAVIGVLYLGFLFPHFAVLYREGKEWVLWVLIVVFAGDTSAYFVGMAVGGRRLYPEISPGKTVAGAVGSMAGSLVGGVLAGYALISVSLELLAVLAIGLNVLGQVGDLFESWIKRTFTVKDAGRLLPGHGGVMDRIDSLIFPGVVSTFCVRLLHQ